MKRTFPRLAVIATVGTALAWAPAVVADPPAGGAPPAPRPQRICIVNMPKVLKEYDKANFKGAEITKKRQRVHEQMMDNFPLRRQQAPA